MWMVTQNQEVCVVVCVACLCACLGYRTLTHIHLHAYIPSYTLRHTLTLLLFLVFMFLSVCCCCCCRRRRRCCCCCCCCCCRDVAVVGEIVSVSIAETDEKSSNVRGGGRGGTMEKASPILTGQQGNDAHVSLQQ